MKSDDVTGLCSLSTKSYSKNTNGAILVAESSGCIGLTVDAKDNKAAGFYAGFGFRQAPENGLLLFMPLPEIQALFADG